MHPLLRLILAMEAATRRNIITSSGFRVRASSSLIQQLTGYRVRNLVFHLFNWKYKSIMTSLALCFFIGICLKLMVRYKTLILLRISSPNSWFNIHKVLNSNFSQDTAYLTEVFMVLLSTSNKCQGGTLISPWLILSKSFPSH
jgi:hypothetical protein